MPALQQVRQRLAALTTGPASILSGLLVVMLLMCACGLSCLIYGQRRRPSNQDPLESRITSVLQPQNISNPQEPSRGSFYKESPQPEGGLGLHSGGVPTNWVPELDMPPPLSVSTVLTTRKVELQVRMSQLKDAAATGKDGIARTITFLSPTAALLLKATVQKVDGESGLFVDITEQIPGGNPSAMVHLINKDAAPRMHFFGGPKPLSEIHCADGANSLYGTVEMTRNGTWRLVSATTNLPVATIGGDVKRLDLGVRTNGGKDVATVSPSSSSSMGGDVSICVHTGADLVLAVSLLLSVLLSAQI